MEIIRTLDTQISFRNPVVTIGSFDGVHLGHRQIFKEVKEKASSLNGESVAITFDPHPQQLLHHGMDFFLLNSLEEKIDLISREGVDYLIVFPFTYAFASQSFSQFFYEILVNKIGMKALVMGPNHSMGKNREGNLNAIRRICQEENIELKVAPELIIGGHPVRSQRIRTLIQEQRIEEASRLLGRSL